MILNLGGITNIPKKWEIGFKTSTFPGGEEFIRLENFEDKDVKIVTRLNSSKDIMQLLMAVDALRRCGVTQIHLTCPYFPYARQDRVMNPGESLSVAVLANLINSLNFQSVCIIDPHSDVTSALLNNVIVCDNSFFIGKVLKDLQEDVVIISPDAGASKKIFKLHEKFGLSNDIIQCVKIRDLKTTTITGTQVYGDVTGRNCLIIDDICDGGRTFTTLGQILKQNGANELYLAVTHGIFSSGFTELNKYFARLFTTDSFYRGISEDNLTVVNLFEVRQC